MDQPQLIINNFTELDYHPKRGLVGNGIDKYLDSNLPADTTTVSFHMAAYMITSLPRNTYAMGRTDSKGFHTWIWASPALGFGGGYANKAYPFNGPSPLRTPGFIGHSRSASGQPINKRQYKTTTTNDAAATHLMDDGTFKIFCYDNKGVLSGFTGARMAYYSIGRALDIEKLDNRVSTLIADILAS